MNYLIDNVEEYTLNNGLRVLLKQSKSAPVLTCQLWFKVGSVDEPMGLSGSAHLIEHMLFRKSKNFKGGEISQILRSLGGIDNAATSYDYTYYWVLLGPEHIDFSLKIMAERFCPKFDKEELKKEVGVVLSELEGYENRPTTKIVETLTNTAFEKSAYRRPIIGYREDLENINRNELVAFYKKFYVPNNATLVLVGDFDNSEAKKLINKYFKPIKKGIKPIRKNYCETPQKGIKTALVNMPGETKMSYIGFHIPNIHHKDMDAITMLSGILAEGKASRLQQNLVETGKAVNVMAFPFTRKYDSLFLLGAVANSKYSEEELKDFLFEEIEKIKNNPITDEEIVASLNQTKADIIYEIDSVSGLGNALGIADVYGSWRDYNRQIPRLENVTKEDINYVLNKYFQKNNATVILTNLNSGEKAVEVPVGEPEKYNKTKNKLFNITKEIKDEPQRYVLSNGIKLLVKENHITPTVAMEGFIRHGDMYEPINCPGVSKLMSDMIYRGTKTRSYLEIANSLDKVGAYIDYDVTCEKFSFTGKALSEYADLLLYNLSDCLINPTFLKKEALKLRDEAITSMLYNRQIPSKLANQVFYNNVVNKGMPFYLPTFDETIEYAKNFKTEELKDFYNELNPKDMVLSVVGDIDKNKIKYLCEKYFSEFKAKSDYIVKCENVYKNPSEMKIIDIPMENMSESAVIYGYPVNMKRGLKDFYKYQIANQVFGGGGALNSWLGQEIRENRGLVYGIYSNLSGGHYNGIWKVSFGTNRKYVNEALECVENLMKKFLNQGISEQEMNDTKNFIMGMFAKGLETNEGVASVLCTMEDYNLGMDYIYTKKDIFDKITLNDANEIREKYIFPGKGLTVICG